MFKMELKERILKDISIFEENSKKIKSVQLTQSEAKIFELAKLYKEDSIAWLKKGDLDTSFSCISYAHGLLDALLKLKGLQE